MENKKCCDPINVKKISAFFKVLGDSNRLDLFSYICNCHRKGASDCNVSELTTCCDVDFSGVSRHLNTLKEAGILQALKVGKEVRYFLGQKEAHEIASTLRSLANFIEMSAQGPQSVQVINPKQGEKHESRSKKDC